MSNRLTAFYQAKAIVMANDMQRESYEAVVERALARRGERRSFLKALQRSESISIIAEIKRASPSAGRLVSDFDVAVLARRYQEAGADAMSVLTEESVFLGHLSYLDIARSQSSCPILRKDFLATSYEVAQAAAHGADAVLLIVAGLSDRQLSELLEQAQRFDLDALVEVHTAAEIDRALAVGATIIGINNRDLRTFHVDLQTTESLASRIPEHCCIITESGIQNAEQIERALRVGAHAALIGEAAMRADDLKAFFANLRGPVRHA